MIECLVGVVMMKKGCGIYKAVLRCQPASTYSVARQSEVSEPATRAFCANGLRRVGTVTCLGLGDKMTN